MPSNHVHRASNALCDSWSPRDHAGTCLASCDVAKDAGEMNEEDVVPLHIVLLEDDPRFVELLSNQLVSDHVEHELVRVASRDEFIEAIESSRVDIILADFSVPVFDGGAALAIAQDRRPDLPFIFVSGAIGERLAIDLLKRGATDYVLKDNLALLAPAVRRARREAVARAEHRIAERALRRSEARYRALVDMSPSAVLVHVAGRIVFANRAGFQMFGAVSADELLGQPMVDLVHPSSRARMVDRVHYMNTMGEAVPCAEEKFCRLDGSVIDSEVVAAPIEYEGRRAIQLIFTDITGRKAVEAALRESEEHARQIVDNALDAVVTMDRGGVVVGWNRQAEVVFGWSVDEAIGKLLTDLIIPEEHREAQRIGLARLALSSDGRSQNRRQEIHAQCRDGERLIVEIAISPVLRGGVATTFSAFLRDITEVRRTDEMKRQLEARVRQVQKMEAIGTLAGGIAHDFNNILTGIIMNVDLAMEDLKPEHPARESLDEIARASRRAADLVGQILTFSRQREQERGPIHLEPVVSEALKLLRASLPSSIEIRPRVERDRAAVLADASRIHQIVMNLGTNAAHAMREHGGVLDVALETVVVNTDEARQRHDLKEGRYVRITVADSGCGMDRATIDRIFEPFFTTKAPGEGTGLGLSVVHGIVRSHDGVITVWSEIDRGTTFQVHFPVYEVRTPAFGIPAVPRPAGGRERVLLVDDEEAVARSSARILERFGYRATYHTDPEVALAAFRERPEGFDIVISDLTMPGISGIELSRAMLEVRPDLPVILMSGYVESGTLEDARKVGVRDVLLKPVVPNLLAERVREALARRPTRATSG